MAVIYSCTVKLIFTDFHTSLGGGVRDRVCSTLSKLQQGSGVAVANGCWGDKPAENICSHLVQHPCF
jgi:hypothetical protein